MINVTIVCTHDAVKTAEVLTRLLEAEEHQVRILHGRQSASAMAAVKTSDDAVLLIWSANAPSQHYMLEWARNIDPSRLIEIGRAPGWPRSDRKAPVIDFVQWRGERGGRAWNALNERLRLIQRQFEPVKPPPRRAAMALGLASIAAVGGAVVVRMNDQATPDPANSAVAETTNEQIFVETPLDPAAGLGGAINAFEPASVEDEFRPLAPARYAPLPHLQPDLLQPSAYSAPELRDPTLIERITAFNPLRNNNDDSE